MLGTWNRFWTFHHLPHELAVLHWSSRKAMWDCLRQCNSSKGGQYIISLTLTLSLHKWNNARIFGGIRHHMEVYNWMYPVVTRCLSVSCWYSEEIIEEGHGKKMLHLDKFSTIATEVEAITNAWTLTHLYTDVDSPTVLTPTYFLGGTDNCVSYMFWSEMMIQTTLWVPINL